jgi:2-oxoglutarate ferredoxin oxidoreductase subunit beta
VNNLKQIQDKAQDLAAFEGKNKHTWCSGCGDYGILNAIKRALTLEDITPEETMFCFDVGCNGNASDKINANTIHGLHGRVTSLASGIANSNTKMTVVATAGDGATFSEGINHLLHSIRNNYNVTFICHNNSNYGLTIGQASSTTKKGQRMSATPGEVTADPLNTIDLVLGAKPGFVARSFSGDIKHMTDMIRQAINHKGFSYVEIMQVCPTFNKATPQEWYWDKIYYLDEKAHNSSDLLTARKVAMELEEDRIALGKIYENKQKVEFLESLEYRKDFNTELYQETKHYPINQYLTEFI